MSHLAAYSAELSGAMPEQLADQSYFNLPAAKPPWTATAIRLRRGQQYSLLADGRIQWSVKRPELYGGPGFHLWARLNPSGKIVNVTRNSGTFVADVDGELELGIYFGMWDDHYGALAAPLAPYHKLTGALDVCVLAWRGDALVGGRALAHRHPNQVLTAELERLGAGIEPPADWSYLPETGTSDIFRPCPTDKHMRICLNAEDDQGIIRKPVDFALTPTTRLSWRWRVTQHPSEVAENTPYSHDYVSIAAEFDNGRDLTWIWSRGLALESWFACPIAAWSARETHYVVRSSETELGLWVDDQRVVARDVAEAMGDSPSKIVAIWLIGVATFQHRTASAEFEQIRLNDGNRSLTVL